MRRFLISALTGLTLLLAIVPTAIAYPEDQFNECMIAAKANPSLVGVSESYIEGFCDCALTAILDEGKSDKASAKECARKTSPAHVENTL